MFWLKIESRSIRLATNDVERKTIPKPSGLQQGAFVSCSWVCRRVWYGWSKLGSAELLCVRLQVRWPLLQVEVWLRSCSHASHLPWTTGCLGCVLLMAGHWQAIAKLNGAKGLRSCHGHCGSGQSHSYSPDRP